MAPGDGQYRLRIQRFRFRYDIKDRLVALAACSLRREDSYQVILYFSISLAAQSSSFRRPR